MLSFLLNIFPSRRMIFCSAWLSHVSHSKVLWKDLSVGLYHIAVASFKLQSIINRLGNNTKINYLLCKNTPFLQHRVHIS